MKPILLLPLAILIICIISGCVIINQCAINNLTNTPFSQYLSFERDDLGWDQKHIDVQIIEPQKAYRFSYDVFIDTYLILTNNDEVNFRIKLPKDSGTYNLYSIVQNEKGGFEINQSELDGFEASALTQEGTIIDSVFYYPGTVRMTVVQRHSKAIPGFDGNVRIEIGKIIHGRVPLTIRSKTGEPIVETLSVKDGDSVSFKYEGWQYYISSINLRTFSDRENIVELEISQSPSN